MENEDVFVPDLLHVSELNWKVVQVTAIALLTGIAVTLIELLLGMPVFIWIYVLSGGIPLLIVALWLRQFSQFRYNHYVVMLGLIAINVAIYYFVGDWVLFFLTLFAQAMISLYQNRRLLWAAVGLQVALFTVIYATDPAFIGTMPRLQGSVGSTVGDVYTCVILGGIFFDFLTTYVVRLTRRVQYGEKIRQILDAAMEAVVGIDGQGQIHSWNALAESLFGWTVEEAQGQVFWQLIVPENQQDRLNAIVTPANPTAAPMRRQRVEVLAHSRDGRQFPVEMAVVAVPGEGGAWEQIAFMSDISERKRYEEELVARASYDGLTNLLNHQEFQTRLRQQVDTATRYGRPLSLLMLDLDHFKAVNDTYGHVAGDAVLRKLGEILLNFGRNGDVAARWGGEEFALLLSQVKLESAIDVAERLRAQVESHPFFIDDDQQIPVTVSIGVSCLRHGDMEAVELVESADRALYAAKMAGRNRVEAVT